MRIQVSGKGFEVSNGLREQVEKKIGKLDRYLRKETDVFVTLMTERNNNIIEVTIPMDGVVLRGEESSIESMHTCIDLVLDKLERQIRKHKTRLSKRLRDDAFTEPTPVDLAAMNEEVEEDAVAGYVVRTKRFAIKPMSVEEAALQMELLGHSFFVFLNGDTEEVNVLYIRKDGNYGLIEPEFD